MGLFTTAITYVGWFIQFLTFSCFICGTYKSIFLIFWIRIGCFLAFSKKMFFHNNIAAISFHSFAVCITSRADISADDDFGSFFQIAFCKFCKYMISGAFVSRPIKITLFIAYSSFFCSDLLVPYESGLDSIESTKTISLPLHQTFFFTPSYNETLRG